MVDQLASALPVDVRDLLIEERQTLLDLLRDLEPAAWESPTECPAWSVKGICLHILGDDLSILSRQRDAQPSPVALAADAKGWDQLFVILDRFNEAWVQAASFLSTALLCELLELCGTWTHGWYTTAEPGRLGEPVAWAGPEPAPYWFLAAREYLERWIHQQQIRRAVGASPLDEARWVLPAVAVTARGLPQGLALLPAETGTTVSLSLPGGGWTVLKGTDAWELYDGVPDKPTTRLDVRLSDASLIFSRALPKSEFSSRIGIHGDKELGSTFVAGLAAFFGR